MQRYGMGVGETSALPETRIARRVVLQERLQRQARFRPLQRVRTGEDVVHHPTSRTVHSNPTGSITWQHEGFGLAHPACRMTSSTRCGHRGPES